MAEEGLLSGQNESVSRLHKMMSDTNTGRISYPKSTNERGEGGREHHAHGDRVGGEGSAPGRGGSHMGSHYGKPDCGMEQGAPRKMAARQAHAENHAMGDRVGKFMKQAQEGASKFGKQAQAGLGKAQSGINKAAGQAQRGAEQGLAGAREVHEAGKRAYNAVAKKGPQVREVAGQARRSINQFGSQARGAAAQVGNALNKGASRARGLFNHAEGGNVSQEDMSMNRSMGGYRRGGRTRED